MIGVWLAGWVLMAGLDGKTGLPEAESLPVVVLAGDSIRLGYADVVADRLRGRARVVSTEGNGGSSRLLLHHLDDWVIRHRPAVVHFGAGLHDIMTDPGTGARMVEPAEYRGNLQAITRRLYGETAARLIFATTTPILEARRLHPMYLMRETDIEAYNSAAGRVVAAWPGVAVDDLHARALAVGLDRVLTADGVHFTRAGSVALGEQVAAAVAQALEDPPVARRIGCRRAIVPPRIDGRVLDDPAWSQAPGITAFAQTWGSPSAPRGATEARVLWDDEALYFAATLVDDHVAAFGSRPNDRIWLGDAFGLVVQPDPTRPAYCEFQVNPASVALQLAIPGPGADFAALARGPSLGMVAAAAGWRDQSRPSAGWAVEGRVPWAAFDRGGRPPVPGSSWRVTLFRHDRDLVGSRPTLTAAAPLRRPDVHRLDESSQLVFEP